MKRFISLIITLVMLLSTLSTAIFANDAGSDLPFEDLVAGAWYVEGIEYCYERGIVSGMTESTIVPRETATRAQACRMVMCFNEYIVSGGPKDTDGAFKVMADYITENGKKDEYFISCYSYTETVDGVAYEAFYEPEMEFIVFSYGENQVDGYIGDTYFRKYASLSVDGLRTAYGYMFYDYSEEGKSVDQSGFMRSDGFTEHMFDYEGYEEAEAVAKADEVRGNLMSFVEDFLTKCEVSLVDFYKIEITE